MLPASLPRMALAHPVRQTGVSWGETAFYLVYHSNKIDLFHIIFRSGKCSRHFSRYRLAGSVTTESQNCSMDFTTSIKLLKSTGLVI